MPLLWYGISGITDKMDSSVIVCPHYPQVIYLWIQSTVDGNSAGYIADTAHENGALAMFCSPWGGAYDSL